MKQSQIYTQVYAVLSFLNDTYIKRIPRQVLDLIEKNRDRNYLFTVNKNIPLEQQNLSEEAIAMLAYLKLNYWCNTKEEKEQLLSLFEENSKKEKM